MPSTDTIVKQNVLFEQLAKLLDNCSDDYGLKGCDACNMRIDCEMFWDRVNKILYDGRTLKAHDFQVLSRDFQRLKDLRMLPDSAKNTLGYIKN
jgi:hypothetical protein